MYNLLNVLLNGIAQAPGSTQKFQHPHIGAFELKAMERHIQFSPKTRSICRRPPRHPLKVRYQGNVPCCPTLSYVTVSPESSSETNKKWLSIHCFSGRIQITFCQALSLNWAFGLIHICSTVIAPFNTA